MTPEAERISAIVRAREVVDEPLLAEARALLLRAFRAGRASLVETRAVLDVSKFTLRDWIIKLSLESEIERLRVVAQSEGWAAPAKWEKITDPKNASRAGKRGMRARWGTSKRARASGT